MWSGVVRRSFAHLCFILNENCSQLCEMAANAPPLRLRCPWKCYVSSRYRPFRRISSVAGVDAPAFVERLWKLQTYSGLVSGVAGVDAPAFVERTETAIPGVARGAYPRASVSPGLMPRPSLSGPGAPWYAGGDQVSPGLMPRPSLSEHSTEPSNKTRLRCRRVSPGLMPRPSLSAPGLMPGLR